MLSELKRDEQHVVEQFTPLVYGELLHIALGANSSRVTHFSRLAEAQVVKCFVSGSNPP
jgi:hypothetical protein